MRANHVTRFLVPKYDPARVQSAADVTGNQLHHWFSRNLLELTYKGHGHGKRRRFTGLEAVRLAIMASLDRKGVAIKKARDIALAVTAPLEHGKKIPENAIEYVSIGPFQEIEGWKPSWKPIGDWSDAFCHARVQDPRVIFEGGEWDASPIFIAVGRTVAEVLHGLEHDVLDQDLVDLEDEE